jgi:general secretion pathway protein F
MKALPPPTRVAALYRMLASLASAGIPPAQAALALEGGGSGGRQLAESFAAGLRSGRSFADAAREAGLPEAHVAALEAAEISGTLDTVLAQLAASLEAEAALRREARSLCLQPAMILLACALISPLPALVSGGLASYMRGALPFLLVIWAAATLGGLVLAALRSGSRSFVGQLPATADVVILAARSRACRMAGLLLGAGLPMPKSLRLAGAAGGEVVASAFQRAARDVEAGARLTDALVRARALDGVAASCAMEGEVTGRLDRAFPQAATLLEAELARTLRRRVRVASAMAYVLATAFVAWQVFATFGQIGGLAE